MFELLDFFIFSALSLVEMHFNSNCIKSACTRLFMTQRSGSFQFRNFQNFSSQCFSTECFKCHFSCTSLTASCLPFFADCVYTTYSMGRSARQTQCYVRIPRIRPFQRAERFFFFPYPIFQWAPIQNIRRAGSQLQKGRNGGAGQTNGRK